MCPKNLCSWHLPCVPRKTTEREVPFGQEKVCPNIADNARKTLENPLKIEGNKSNPPQQKNEDAGPSRNRKNKNRGTWKSTRHMEECYGEHLFSTRGPIRRFPQLPLTARSRLKFFRLDSEELPEGPGEGTTRCPPRGCGVVRGLFVRILPEGVRHERGRGHGGAAGTGG